jgi:dihydrofolate reductase
MGRNTFLSLPKGGLPKRKHVIVSNKINSEVDAKKLLGDRYIENLTFIKVENLEDFIKKEQKNNNISIIGGAMLYCHFILDKNLFNLIDNVYATEVERIPNIKNPIKLEVHTKLKDKFKSEIIKVGRDEDRLDDKNVVNFKVIRYYN